MPASASPPEIHSRGEEMMRSDDGLSVHCPHSASTVGVGVCQSSCQSLPVRENPSVRLLIAIGENERSPSIGRVE